MMLLNVLLGTAVVAVGFWLLWGTVASATVIAWTFAVGGFLWWKAKTVTELWAWSTLLLGVESFAWPAVLMIQLKSAAGAPSEDEMGTVLSAVVPGLFSSVFWISFSYGLFKRAGGTESGFQTAVSPKFQRASQPTNAKKTR